MTDHAPTETAPAALAPASAQDLTLIPGPYDLALNSDEPIHDYFELSHATHLVMPRTILQSMPVWWQQEFVRLMRKYDQACQGLPEEQRDINHCVQAGDWKYPYDVPEDTLAYLGWSYGDDRQVIYDAQGVEHSVHTACVFVPYAQDPIPHYQRGRTRLPLARILRTTHS